MGSSAKTERLLPMESQGALFWAQNIKVPFGMGHLSTCTSNLVICVQKGSGVINLQTEFSYLNSFTFYRVFTIWASSAPGGGAGG